MKDIDFEKPWLRRRNLRMRCRHPTCPNQRAYYHRCVTHTVEFFFARRNIPISPRALRNLTAECWGYYLAVKTGLRDPYHWYVDDDNAAELLARLPTSLTQHFRWKRWNHRSRRDYDDWSSLVYMIRWIEVAAMNARYQSSIDDAPRAAP